MAKGRDLTTEAEIDAAVARAQLTPDLPRALSAEYIRALDLVLLQVDNGQRLVIPREQLQGLEHATEAQLSHIEIFGGLDIAWPELDVDHYLPHLLEGKYATEKWKKAQMKQVVAA